MMNSLPQGYGYYPMPNQQYGGFPNMQAPIQQVVFSDRKLEHLNCIFPEQENSGALFIGDTISTLRHQYLIDNKIGAVLCCNQQASKNVHMTKIPFDYKYMQIQDHIDYPIKLHFDSAVDFIDSKIKAKKNVLVQCHGGASRSVTLVIAYLMKIKGWTLEQAFKFTKEKRHRAKPNAGFWKQLEEYATLLNKNSNQQNEINFKTPVKPRQSKQQSLSTSKAQNMKTRASQKLNDELQSIESKEKIQKQQNQQNIKSEGLIKKQENIVQKQTKTQKKPKRIFKQDDRIRSVGKQVVSNRSFNTQAPYQYFKQQNDKNKSIHKSPSQTKHFSHSQQTFYPPQTYQQSQPIIQRPYYPTHPQQVQQVYYMQPQYNYAPYINNGQPANHMWLSR